MATEVSTVISPGKRNWATKGLIRKESQSISKPNFEKLQNVTKANFVHVYPQTCRLQAGLDSGLRFELCGAEGHAPLTDVWKQPWGRGPPRNKLLAPQQQTHIFSHHQRGCCQEITQTPNKKQAKRKQRDKTASLLFVGHWSSGQGPP